MYITGILQMLGKLFHKQRHITNYYDRSLHMIFMLSIIHKGLRIIDAATHTNRGKPVQLFIEQDGMSETNLVQSRSISWVTQA